MRFARGRGQGSRHEESDDDRKRAEGAKSMVHGGHSIEEGCRTPGLIGQQLASSAYDDRLGVACGQLGIEQHLGELTGMDLDLERIRVEGLLEAAGLAFRDDSTQTRHWQR